MATGSTVTKEKEHELVLTRVCDAPREPVFKRGPIQSTMAQWQMRYTRVIKSTAKSTADLPGMEAGWKQNLERLNAYLAAESKEESS